jgi:hypothetical protein
VCDTGFTGNDCFEAECPGVSFDDKFESHRNALLLVEGVSWTRALVEGGCIKNALRMVEGVCWTRLCTFTHALGKLADALIDLHVAMRRQLHDVDERL